LLCGEIGAFLGHADGTLGEKQEPRNCLTRGNYPRHDAQLVAKLMKEVLGEGGVEGREKKVDTGR